MEFFRQDCRREKRSAAAALLEVPLGARPLTPRASCFSRGHSSGLRASGNLARLPSRWLKHDADLDHLCLQLPPIPPFFFNALAYRHEFTRISDPRQSLCKRSRMMGFRFRLQSIVVVAAKRRAKR